MTVDLIIRGGIVVDGTGLARRRADLAIHEGRIQSLGHLPEDLRAEQEIDAEVVPTRSGLENAYVARACE